MTLTIHKKIRHNNVTFKEGHAYEFSYQAYQNDPSPIIFFINAIKGTHPSTNHQWRLMQGINISYISRKDRKRFVKKWRDEMNKSKGDVNFTWNRVKREFPYLKLYIRRYMLKPNYYIRNIKYIPPEQWDKAVVKSWTKDFSSVIKRNVAARLKRLFTGRRNKR